MLSIWERNTEEWITVRETQEGGQQVNHSQSTTAYYEDDAILRSYHRFHFDDSPILGSVPNLSMQMAKGTFTYDVKGGFGEGVPKKANDIQTQSVTLTWLRVASHLH